MLFSWYVCSEKLLLPSCHFRVLVYKMRLLKQKTQFELSSQGILVLTLKMHIAYAYVKQECCIFGGTKCHGTAGVHFSLESSVPSKALDQQAAACTQITAAEALSMPPTLAGPVASLGA